MRKWIETVKPWPVFTRNRLYQVRVKAVRKSPQGKAILMDLEFLEGQQKGRSLSEKLELPIRLEGRSANYFYACGQQVKLEAKLSPKATIGSVIGVRLDQDSAGQWRVIDFEPITQEKNHELTIS